MLQRVQSLWLLGAAAFTAITFRFPFYVGDWMKDATHEYVALNATTNLTFTILTVILGLLAFLNIFFFTNRKLQLKLCYTGIVLSLLLLALYFIEMRHFRAGEVTIWIIFYLAILVCFILATKGIMKDEKLIKSMDRLR